MPCCKKVMVIGASGLIGREVVQFLQDFDCEIFAVTRTASIIIGGAPIDVSARFTEIQGDIFDEAFIASAFKKIQPTHLLNFAWTTTGDYLHSDTNMEYVKAGFNILQNFKKNGGKKAIFSGTCLEYAPQAQRLTEFSSLAPQTLYAKCKNSLRELSEAYCKQHDIDFGWGRIFYVYGRGEHKSRLTAHIIDSLHANKDVSIAHGHIIKDYMYTKDIAGAFIQFLFSDICGCVNVCTGQGISLGEYASTIAKILHKEQYLHIDQKETTQASYIVGDSTKLIKEVQYTMQYTLLTALNELVQEKQ